jgi:hypothetical protein
VELPKEIELVAVKVPVNVGLPVKEIVFAETFEVVLKIPVPVSKKSSPAEIPPLIIAVPVCPRVIFPDAESPLPTVTVLPKIEIELKEGIPGILMSPASASMVKLFLEPVKVVELGKVIFPPLLERIVSLPVKTSGTFIKILPEEVITFERDIFFILLGLSMEKEETGNERPTEAVVTE